ncbi:MAG: universal stress protein [Desulfobulbaceae bacterium]|nr:universal stress protein [Desulfobulbaceae bacterium]
MKRFKNILFISGPEEEKGKSFQRAVELAEHNGAELMVIEVIEGVPNRKINSDRYVLAGKLLEIMIRERLTRLERMIEPIIKNEKIQVSAKVVTGRLFLEVIKEVLRGKHDLVIKSTADQKGLTSALFGSSDMHLLRKCPCPVWIIKHGEKLRCSKVMAALDVHTLDGDLETGELNLQILEMASFLAVIEKSELHIAHAWYFFGADYLWGEPSLFTELEAKQWQEEEGEVCRLKLEELASNIKEVVETLSAEPNRLHIHLKEGDPKEIIPQLVREQNIDLVVMGTVSRSGISGFFIGNTAESILHDINCSVLAVKPPGFVSPVRLEEQF